MTVKTGMANPFVHYKTIEEAQAALNFTIKMPTTPNGYELISIHVMANVMLQLTYEKEKTLITYRMEQNEHTIDGVYKEFDIVEEEKIDDKVITFKGDDCLCEVVTWFEGAFTYALVCNLGENKRLLVSMIQSIK